LPYATYCIQCAREAEKYGSVGGHDQDWGRISESGGGESEATLDDIEIDVS
jgi:hypothetical protein